MLFVVFGFDGQNTQEKRTKHYPQHRVFLASAKDHGIRIVMSGPLVEDDGTTPIGSLFVFEAADRQTVEAFHAEDPFFRHDVWESTKISAFVRKR